MNKAFLGFSIVITLLLGPTESFSMISSAKELDFFYQYVPAVETLTTEKLWKIAPEELNPEYTLWGLERSTDLLGLKSVIETMTCTTKLDLLDLEGCLSGSGGGWGYFWVGVTLKLSSNCPYYLFIVSKSGLKPCPNRAGK